MQRFADQVHIVFVLLVAQACGEAECIIPPCAPPLALEVTVIAEGTGTPVSGVSIAVTGVVTGGGPCSEAKCLVLGGAGTYEFDVSAAGYRTIHQSAVVHGSNPECGCPTVDTERLTVALPLNGL
jgi:hypothetical protein